MELRSVNAEITAELLSVQNDNALLKRKLEELQQTRVERSVDEDWMRSQGTIIRHQMGRMRKEAAVLKALVRVMQTHQRRMVRSCIRVIRENGSGQPGVADKIENEEEEVVGYGGGGRGNSNNGDDDDAHVSMMDRLLSVLHDGSVGRDGLLEWIVQHQTGLGITIDKHTGHVENMAEEDSNGSVPVEEHFRRYRQTIAALWAQVQGLQDRMHTMQEEERRAKRAQQEGTQHQREVDRVQMRAIESLVTELGNRWHDHFSRLDQATSRLELRLTRIDGLGRAPSQHSRFRSAQEGSLQRLVRLWSGRMRGLQSVQGNLERQVRILEQQKRELAAAVGGRDGEIQHLHSRCDKLQRDKEALRKSLAAQRADMASVQQEAQQQLEKSARRREGELEAAKQRLEESNREGERLRRKCAALERQLEVAAAERDGREMLLGQLGAKVEALKREAAEAEQRHLEDMARMQTELDTARLEYDDLIRRYATITSSTTTPSSPHAAVVKTRKVSATRTGVVVVSAVSEAATPSGQHKRAAHPHHHVTDGDGSDDDASADDRVGVLDRPPYSTTTTSSTSSTSHRHHDRHSGHQSKARQQHQLLEHERRMELLDEVIRTSEINQQLEERIAELESERRHLLDQARLLDHEQRRNAELIEKLGRSDTEGQRMAHELQRRSAELEEAQNALSELHCALRSRDREIAELVQRGEALVEEGKERQIELDRVRETQRHTAQEAEQLRSNLAELEREAALQADELRRLTALCKELEEQLHMSNDVHEETERKLGQVSHTRRLLERELAQSRRTVESLQEQVETLQGKCRELVEEGQKLASQLSAEQERVHALQSTVHDLRRERDEHECAAREHEGTIAEQRDKIRFLREERAKLEVSLSHMTKCHSSAEDEVAALTERNTALDRKVKQLEVDLGAAHSHAKNLQLDLDKGARARLLLQEKLDTLQERYDSDMKAAQRAREEQQEEVRALEERLAEMGEEMEQHKGRILELVGKVQRGDREHTKMRQTYEERVAEMEGVVEDLEARIRDELEVQLREARGQVSSLERDLQELRENYNAVLPFHERYKKLTAEHQALETRFTEEQQRQRDEVHRLQQELSAAAEALRAAEDALSTEQGESEALRAKIRSLTTSLVREKDMLMDQAEVFAADMRRLKTSVQSGRDYIAQLKETSDAHEKLLKKARRMRHTLEGNVADLEAQLLAISSAVRRRADYPSSAALVDAIAAMLQSDTSPLAKMSDTAQQQQQQPSSRQTSLPSSPQILPAPSTMPTAAPADTADQSRATRPPPSSSPPPLPPALPSSTEEGAAEKVVGDVDDSDDIAVDKEEDSGNRGQHPSPPPPPPPRNDASQDQLQTDQQDTLEGSNDRSRSASAASTTTTSLLPPEQQDPAQPPHQRSRRTDPLNRWRTIRTVVNNPLIPLPTDSTQQRTEDIDTPAPPPAFPPPPKPPQLQEDDKESKQREENEDKENHGDTAATRDTGAVVSAKEVSNAPHRSAALDNWQRARRVLANPFLSSLAAAQRRDSTTTEGSAGSAGSRPRSPTSSSASGSTAGTAGSSAYQSRRRRADRRAARPSIARIGRRASITALSTTSGGSHTRDNDSTSSAV